MMSVECSWLPAACRCLLLFLCFIGDGLECGRHCRIGDIGIDVDVDDGGLGCMENVDVYVYRLA